MRFDESVEPFLVGEKFSNGLHVKLCGEVGEWKTRIQVLLELCDSKRVLHIGFTDHIPLITEKIRNGVWLHKLLLERTTKCIGVDVNSEAVAYCRDTLRIPNTYHHDIVSDSTLSAISDDYWDIAILGEVVEHLPDPVSFLAALRGKYGDRIGKIVITVPNAWNLSNFLLARHSIECLNTDHRFWFTAYTLAKIANDAGLVAVEFGYAHQKEFPDKWIYKWLRNRYPMLRETLIGTFVPKV